MVICTLTGAVLERVPRTYPNGDAYTIIRVLSGKSDVTGVRFVPTRFEGDLPREGELVTITARISAYANRSGVAQLSVDALSVEPAAEPVNV